MPKLLVLNISTVFGWFTVRFYVFFIFLCLLHLESFEIKCDPSALQRNDGRPLISAAPKSFGNK